MTVSNLYPFKLQIVQIVIAFATWLNDQIGLPYDMDNLPTLVASLISAVKTRTTT